MKRLISAVVSCALALSGAVMPAAAQAPSMPTIWSASQQTAKPGVETVRHHRHYRGGRHYGPRRYYGHRRYYGPRRYYGHGRYYGPRRYYGYRHHDHGAGAAVAAGIIGLAAGAALAAPRGYSSRHAYCASKYRSYDPRTGTYLGYDGRRHACR